MIKRKQLGVLIALGLFVSLASLTPKPPKSAGAPAERTGAPTVFSGKEGTCQIGSCHGDFSLNSGNGILSVECVDCNGIYTAGAEHVIRVSIKASGFDKFGFQAVVLMIDDIYNVQAGVPVLLDPVRTQIIEANSQAEWMIDRKYITHTFDGNVADGDSASWEFKWIAPENTTDTVTVYVAALTADNDLEMAGDYVYTAALSLSGVLVGINPSTKHLDLSVYPNPATDVLYVRSSDNLGLMELKLFSLNGAEVYRKLIVANETIQLDVSKLGGSLYLYSLKQDGIVLKQGKIAIR